MTVACIVQARLRSTRLPAKVLLPLPTGRTVLEEVLHRCKQIEGVDSVLCTVPGNIEGKIVSEIAIREADVVFHGPEEHDLIARYMRVVEVLEPDVIVRITSDCPLLDPFVCAEAIKLRERTNAGYVSNAWPSRSFAHGHDVEVFTRGALEKAHREATDLSDREHVCPYMQRDESVKKAFLKAHEDRSHIRWTLDTLDDYVAICNEFSARSLEAAA